VTETSSIQNRGLESGSLIVGRIRPPMAMWAALEGITSTTAVKHGVLIIFSQEVRGRIGVFCNRYISGAVLESTGESGLDAVRTLLSIKGGMFGFRACMANEWDEVGQSLGLDIDELLMSRTTDEDADHALRGLMVPGSQLVRGSDAALFEDEEERSEALQPAAQPVERTKDKEPTTESSNEGDFSYLDWFADQMGQKEELPKFRQILMTALPKATTAENEHNQEPEQVEQLPAEPESDMHMYGKLLQSEQDKVIRDIERSMERGRVEPEKVEEAVSDLQLLSEFIQSEQDRAQKWIGLDQIPTPKAAGGSGARVTSETLKTSQRMRAANFEATGNTTQDVDNLVASSVSRVTSTRDFVKPISDSPMNTALPNRIDVTVHFWQRPPVIIALSVIAIGGLVFAISSHQANVGFEATLNDARRGLHQNPVAAAKLLTAAIQNHEGNPRGYFYRGIAFGAAGDYDKSIADLDTAFMKGEDRKLVELAKAAAACRNAKYEEAITSCDAVLAREPNNAQAQSLKALSAQLLKAAEPPPVVVAPKPAVDVASTQPVKPKKAGPLDKSIISDALENKETKLPKDPAQLLRMGYDYLRAGDKSEAMAIFSEAVRRSPNEPEARRYLAHLLVEQGSPEAAVSQFNALVSLHSLKSTDVIDYANALNDSGNAEHAQEVLAHFIQQSPNDINMRAELIRLYAAAGKKDQADALYRESMPLATTSEARSLLQDAGGDANETIHIRRR
jgi:tetratricopeptide (TPR) repeat protein